MRLISLLAKSNGAFWGQSLTRVLSLIGSTLILTLATSGYAQAHADTKSPSTKRPNLKNIFSPARRSPLSASAHYSTGMSFLKRKPATRGDLQMAVSAFRTAARLAPDLWEPLAAASLAVFELGDNDEAMFLMAQAIELRGAVGPLAVSFALLAYRAGEPELARAAFAKADRTDRSQTDLAGLKFLDAAFAGTVWHPTNTIQTPQTELGVKTDADDGKSVIIEAYLIRETRQSDRSRGLNLLDGLSLQFGGTLINYNYDMSATGTNTQTGSLAITAPAISYSLNIASSSQANLTLEASPLVLAREGRRSKFLEGGSVLIVPFADDTDPIERDVGVKLEVTPQRVGARDVDLDVVLEMSSISGQSVAAAGRGAGLLQTDKTFVEVSAQIPYGKAIVVGSADSVARRHNDNRSVSRLRVPGLSRREQSDRVRDVLVVLTVRAPNEVRTPRPSANTLSQSLFGTQLAPVSAYGRRPSETPAPTLGTNLPVTLN